jgi:hypothetical protein
MKKNAKLPSKQHQDYDKIFKENLTKTGDALLTKVCGLSHLILENADTTLPRTIERRVDFLKIGTNPETGIRELYHLEFQSAVHPAMAERELLYYAILLEKHRLPVIQYVIYLGEGEWTAPKTLTHKKLNFEYEVICINKIDYELFLASDTPEEIILAILSNFKGENKAQVVKKIITCLQNKTQNRRKLEKYIFQLEILSNLRKLQPIITKQLSTMSIHYDVTTDLRFLQGKEVGAETGKAEGINIGKDIGISIGKDIGINIGIDIGKAEGIDTSIRYLIESNTVPIEQIAVTMKVSVEHVMRIKNGMQVS